MENNLLDTARKIVGDGFGRNDLSVIDNNIANDFIEHQFGMQGGKEGLKKGYSKPACCISRHALSRSKSLRKWRYCVDTFSMHGYPYRNFYEQSTNR